MFIFLGIADQKKENEDFSYDDIDWDTLPEEINHTRSHVQSLLGNRFGRRQSLDDSVVGIKVNNSRRRRGALDALGLIPNIKLHWPYDMGHMIKSIFYDFTNHESFLEINERF